MIFGEDQCYISSVSEQIKDSCLLLGEKELTEYWPFLHGTGQLSTNDTQGKASVDV